MANKYTEASSALLKRFPKAEGFQGFGKVGMALGITAAAGVGFAQGFGERNVSSQAYDFLFNDPEADQNVFGRKLSPISALAPIPMGTVNSIKAGGFRGFTSAVSSGFINPTTIGDHFKNRSYYDDSNKDWSNRMPQVDGSIVFGLRDLRHGG